MGCMKMRALTIASGVLFAATLSACGSGAVGMMGDFPSGYNLRSVNCSAPTPQSGAAVRVVLADMGMSQMMGGVAPLSGHMMLHAAPAEVPAGSVTFIAENLGWRTHELVVLPLAVGRVAGGRVPGADGRVSETGSLGEASASCASGAGDGITSGSTGWVTLKLKPGTYELICNLPNHYADGMYQQITVR
jgi:uncharacterized cupredoxin-like copper-binding protein